MQGCDIVSTFDTSTRWNRRTRRGCQPPRAMTGRPINCPRMCRPHRVGVGWVFRHPLDGGGWWAWVGNTCYPMLSWGRRRGHVVAFGSPHVAACHLLLLKIEPNKKWKSIRTNGNRSEQMEIGPNKWKSNQTNGNRSEQIYGNRWNRSDRIVLHDKMHRSSSVSYSILDIGYDNIGHTRWYDMAATGGRSGTSLGSAVRLDITMRIKWVSMILIFSK